jgi:hypothetical protein
MATSVYAYVIAADCSCVAESPPRPWMLTEVKMAIPNPALPHAGQPRSTESDGNRTLELSTPMSVRRCRIGVPRYIADHLPAAIGTPITSVASSYSRLSSTHALNIW